MNFVKCFILLILFSTTTFIGYLISQKYNDRLKDLKEMKNCLNIFKNKIQFTYEPIPEVFSEISKKSNLVISSIFSNAVIKMRVKSAGVAWEQSIDNTNSNFNKEDKECLKTLGKLLGQTDIDCQINQIELVNNFLSQQIQQASEEKEKNARMYRKLGVIIGIALVIVLI